ncbi:MAG: pyridoxal-phosphate dependent enzyme, partial [Lachnospiraceae bacterium]
MAKAMEWAFAKTPIVPLHLPGNQYYMKRDDLLPFSLGGNKVRIAAAFLADMNAKGANCLIMYGNSRSNLCRVLANACYREGVPTMMVCSDDPDGTHAETANSRLVGLFGTEIIYCAKNAIAPAVDEAFHRARFRGLVPYYIYGNRLGEGNEGVAARAYAQAYSEICRQEEE